MAVACVVAVACETGREEDEEGRVCEEGAEVESKDIDVREVERAGRGVRNKRDSDEETADGKGPRWTSACAAAICCLVLWVLRSGQW